MRAPFLSLIVGLFSSLSSVLAAGDCVNTVRVSGWRPFITYRLFSNSSLAVIDSGGRYAVHSATGSVLYQEMMTLPDDSLTGERAMVDQATISSTGTIYLQLSDGFTYKYSAKAVSQKTAASKRRIMDRFPIVGLPDMALTGMTTGLYGATPNAAGTAMDIIAVDGLIPGPSAGQNQSPFNSTYYSRVNVNTLLNEFYIVVLSKTVYSGKVLAGSPLSINITNANYASSGFDQTDAYHIPSNIGTSTDYMAYSYYIDRDAITLAYPHMLVIHGRGIGSLVTTPLTDFFVHSVAIHPTLTKIYLLTNNGDLYVKDFTPGTPPSFNAGYSLVITGLYFKYAQIDVLDSTTMVLKTVDSMALFDLTTNTIKYHVSIKPSFGRNIFGTTGLMFLAYHNMYLKLYDTTTHSISSAFSYTCALREVVVNQNPTYPRFYVLCSDQIRVYTISTYALVTSKTMSQIATSITNVSISTVTEIFDIDIQINNPTSLIVVVRATTTASVKESAAIQLNENTLAFVAYKHISPNFLCQKVSIVTRPTYATQDVLVFVEQDRFVRYYTPGANVLTFMGDFNARWNTANSNWVIMSSAKFISTSSGSKRSANFNPGATTPESQTKVFLGFRSDIPYSVSGGASVRVEQYPQTYPYLKGMDLIRGNLTNSQFTINYAYGSLVNYFTSPSGPFSSVQSAKLLPGVPYQGTDNLIYVTGGDEYLYTISPITCYNKPTLSDYETVSTPCTITNCLSCNYFSPTNCKLCISGYYPSADGSTCVAVCAAGEYLLNQQCVAMCPIEYYKQTGTPNLCLTAAQCTTGGKVILGDRCTLVSCPTGFTVNATGYCLPNSATTAAMWNDDTTSVTACPAGTLYWGHYGQCTPLANLPTTKYKSDAAASPSPGVIYCDPETHYYDWMTKRCNPTCYTYIWTSATMGRICLSKAACTSQSYFTDDTIIPGTCVSSCNVALFTDLVGKNCAVVCDVSTVAVPTTKTCEATCPASTYYRSTSNECLTSSACLSATLLLSPSTMLCTPTCASTLFYLAATSQCLTSGECVAASGSGGGLYTPSTKTCSSTCTATLFNLVATNQCLTAVECLAAAQGGFTSPSDSVCVTSCPVGKYTLAGTKQCLTSAECKAATGTGGGLVSESTSTCVSTCATSLYLSSSTQQCLTAVECVAASGSGGGLYTPSTKTCSSTCTATLFNLVATNQCLTAVECLAAAQGGFTSPSDSVCVTSCPVGKYTLAGTKQCLTSAECKAATGTGGGLVSESTSTCVSTCATSLYLSSSTQQCLTSTECNALPALYSPASKLCEASCTVTEYLDPTSSICYTKGACMAAGMYWKDVAGGNLCVTSCSVGEYFDSVGKACRTKPQCNSANKLVENTGSTCVSDCPSTLPMKYNGECISICPGGTYLQEFDETCIASCPNLVTTDGKKCLRKVVFVIVSAEQTAINTVIVKLEFYFQDSMNTKIKTIVALPAELISSFCLSADTSTPNCDPSFISSSEFSADGQLTITAKSKDINSVMNTVQVVPNSSIQRFYDGYRGELVAGVFPSPVVKRFTLPDEENAFLKYTKAIGGGATVLVEASVEAAPFLLSTFMGSSSGSVLCLVAQTHAKQMAMSKFNFELGDTDLAKLFYFMFKEFSGDYNQQLMQATIGDFAVAENQQYPCRLGFKKLCFLTVEDNFIVSQFLAFVILAIEIVILLAMIGLFTFLKRKATADTLTTNLKRKIVYVFVVEKGLEFWFTLFLNVHIQIYEIVVLSIFKGVGIAILAFYLVSLFFLLRYRKDKWAVPNFFLYIYNRIGPILGEVAVEEYKDGYIKGFLLHDFLLGLVGVSGSYISSGQGWLWIGFELVYIVLLLRYKVFRTSFMQYRQIVVEALFLALSAQMALVSMVSGDQVHLLTITILSTSLTILFANLMLLLYEIFKSVKEFFKKKKTGDLSLQKTNTLGLSRMHSNSVANSDVKSAKGTDTPLRSTSPRKRTFRLNGSDGDPKTPQMSNSPFVVSRFSAGMKNPSILRNVDTPKSRFGPKESSVGQDKVEEIDIVGEQGEASINNNHVQPVPSLYKTPSHAKISIRRAGTGKTLTLAKEKSGKLEDRLEKMNLNFSPSVSKDYDEESINFDQPKANIDYKLDEPKGADMSVYHHMDSVNTPRDSQKQIDTPGMAVKVNEYFKSPKNKKKLSRVAVMTRGRQHPGTVLQSYPQSLDSPALPKNTRSRQEDS